VGILGRRYGKPLASRFSATHTEYLHAEKHGLRIAVWCLRTDDREGHEQAFLDEVRTFHVVPTFTTPADLQSQVEERLRAIAAEDLAPWCKLGDIVFRATEVADNGDELRVTARIRSDQVAHALEQLRGERVGRGADTRFTWAGRSKSVRVQSLESTTTSARSKTMRLVLEAGESSHDYSLDMSIGDLTPADLTEVGLRRVLFGERSPLDDRHVGFVSELPDPLTSLRDAQVSDEIIRPLAELLIVDNLVGSGRATRVTEFRLGSAVRGMRQLALTWESPRRYSNERPSIRTIRGEVRL
jgi:hypothetical protein